MKIVVAHINRLSDVQAPGTLVKAMIAFATLFTVGFGLFLYGVPYQEMSSYLASRKFQYEVNRVAEQSGTVSLSKSGSILAFHPGENPVVVGLPEWAPNIQLYWYSAEAKELRGAEVKVSDIDASASTNQPLALDDAALERVVQDLEEKGQFQTAVSQVESFKAARPAEGYFQIESRIQASPRTEYQKVYAVSFE